MFRLCCSLHLAGAVGRGLTSPIKDFHLVLFRLSLLCHTNDILSVNTISANLEQNNLYGKQVNTNGSGECPFDINLVELNYI